MLLSEPSIAVADLNKKIEEKVAEKIAEKTLEKLSETPLKTPLESPLELPVLQVVKRPFWQQRWAAAAAILLLFGGSFWFYKNAQMRENQLVMHSENVLLTDTLDNRTPQYKTDFEPKKGSVSTPLTPSNSRSNSDKLAQLEDNKNGVLKDDLGTKNDVIANAKTSEMATKPSAEVADIAPKVEVEKSTPAPASAPVVYAPQVDRTRDYAGASAQNIEMRPTVSTPTKAKDVAAPKETGDDSYDSKKSSESLNEVVVTSTAAKRNQAKPQAPAAKQDPSVSDQILSRADAHFKQKKYENAVADYTQFLNLETAGDRYDRAFFQLANCFVKLNRKAEAKVIFEKLSVTGGPYGRMAKKALKDL